MNRNQNNRFAQIPTVRVGRSKFTQSPSLKTSFNIGELVPTFYTDLLPGDTIKIKTNLLARLQTLVAPIMDNIYLDTYWFFVPNRLVWSHWKEFMGENTSSAWIPSETKTIPKLIIPEGGFNKCTIADYLRIPTKVGSKKINALPFRGYALICNEWFRSEVVTDPLNIYTGDADQLGSNGDNYINDVALGGKPFKVAKFFDLFTSSTISPQKGPNVTINIGEFTGNVVGNGKALGLTDGTNLMHLTNQYTTSWASNIGNGLTGANLPQSAGSYSQVQGSFGVPTAEQLNGNLDNSGLILASSGNIPVVTINQLREAFQVQKFYEKWALYGSRYTETIRAMFGVTSPDARQQRPEYLGGHRINININQVVQSSGTVEGSTPQGHTSAYSVTGDTHDDFTFSATEHGMLFGLVCARYDHTYQNGIPKHFLKDTIWDYYFPVFANLGAQKISNAEIYMQGDDVVNPSTGKPYDEEAFGYNEAWYEYRYFPNAVTGSMRSNADDSLDVWHLADDYTELPHLSDEWIREDKSNIDRALAVTSQVTNQMFADFLFNITFVRPMPLYSIPGLIDHN